LKRKPENRSEEQHKDLEVVLEAYEDLNCTNTLKEELRCLWDYKYGAWARKHLKNWIGRAREAEGIPQLSNFADSLEESKEQILNFFNYRITLGPLEGFNNPTIRIIHRACGHNNRRYLFLKLRQESLDVRLET
jgi:transposase